MCFLCWSLEVGCQSGCSLGTPDGFLKQANPIKGQHFIPTAKWRKLSLEGNTVKGVEVNQSGKQERV
jgi:hypothetical protein